MLENLDKFLSWAKENKWEIIKNNKNEASLPFDVMARYDFPEEYLEFMRKVRKAVTPEGTAWFQLQDDFHPSKDIMMKWNEYELLGKHLAEDDGDLILSQEIESFWNGVIPIFMSVGEGYAYFGIKIDSGEIVFGQEPFFHKDPQVIATNLDQLLLMFASDEIELAE